MKHLFFLLFMFSVSPLGFSQYFDVVKILETNLFELNNHYKVKLYGLNIPSQNDTNKALAQLAELIYKWEKGYFLNRNFKIEFINDVNGIKEVRMFRTRTFSDDNCAKILLSSGYAALREDVDQKYAQELYPFQIQAQKSELGIWSDELFPHKEEENDFSTIKKYERPYLPLLTVSITALVLAWDSFMYARDLGNSIDKLKELKLDTSELENQQTRKVILGIVCSATTIITTLFAFKSLEIKSGLNSLTLSYRF